MEDEMKELNRIWESLEKQLASMSGDQEREYEIINNRIEKKVIGKIDIPTDDNEEEIEEKLKDAFPEVFDPEKVYNLSGDGRDGTIYIQDVNTGDQIAEMTTYDEIEDFDQFMEDILDIERVQYLSGRDGWRTKEYTIVTGTGGPHIEFTTGYSLHVYWGGKQIEAQTHDQDARATIDRIEDYLNECYPE